MNFSTFGIVCEAFTGKLASLLRETKETNREKRFVDPF